MTITTKVSFRLTRELLECQTNFYFCYYCHLFLLRVYSENAQSLSIRIPKRRCYNTSHSAYVATVTESDGVKIDGLLPPNFL